MKFLAWICTALIGIATISTSRAQQMTQTFHLVPGWNSIYLEVEPESKAIDALLGAFPIASVWTWNGRVTATDFIQDPSELLANSNHWLVHYATNTVQSRFNTLFALLPRRAYLLKVSGGQEFDWQIQGTPSLRQPAWAPNAYTLRGFPVDPDRPPTFLNFFRPSGAHYSTKTGLQSIYRLNSVGHWEAAQPGDLMKRGEAYWVFSAGASTYNGPLAVSIAVGSGSDGLDFFRINQETVRFENKASFGYGVTISSLVPNETLPLSVRVFPDAGSLRWSDLTENYTFLLNGGASQSRIFAIRRTGLQDGYGTVVKVTDNLGTVLYLPLAANSNSATPTTALLKRSGKSGPRTAQTSAPSLAGLWVGVATINAVSEPHSGVVYTNSDTAGNQIVIRTNISDATTPTKSTFDLRLLIHVSDDGSVRLLREVTRMQKPAVTGKDSDGRTTVIAPAAEVLLTDRSLFPYYAGSDVRGNAFVGNRLSSTVFAAARDAQWDMQGSFQLNGTLTTTLKLNANSPLNPFLHTYHPDHGAKDSFAITRVITLNLLPQPDSSAGPDPDYGQTLIGGTYQEQISGLHKNPIFCSGAFQLRRASTTGTLNPKPQ